MAKLPEAKSGIDKRWISQKFGMLGHSGIGKSTFWAQDENALFLQCEAGLNYLDVFKVPITSWDDLRQTYGELKEMADSGKFKYSTIVIDTIDRLVDYAEEEVIGIARGFYKKVEINTIGDIPEGGGWAKRQEKVMMFLGLLERLPCAVAWISHPNIKRIEEPTRKYDKTTITIGGKLGLDLLGWTDHTLHLDALQVGDRLCRTVYTIPTQAREAKSRGGVVPDGWKWKDDMVENFKYLRGLFE